MLLILLTTFLCRVWVLCAPAAFLGCDSRFSGSLSGIKPSVSVPRPCHDRPMPSRRKLIGRKLERRVVGQATLLALLQPAAEAGCAALELVVVLLTTIAMKSNRFDRTNCYFKPSLTLSTISTNVNQTTQTITDLETKEQKPLPPRKAPARFDRWRALGKENNIRRGSQCQGA